MTYLILFGSNGLKRISVKVLKNNYESWITKMRMLTRESTIDTWTKLLPNVTDTEQLDDYIKEYWGCTLDEVFDSYDSEADSQRELIDKLICENNSAEYDTVYDAMYSAVTNKYTWNEFFRPLLRNAGEQIIEIIKSCNIIEDKEVLCEAAFDSLFSQCYEMAFRVILQEYGYIKNEGMIKCDTEEEGQKQFNEMMTDPELLTNLYNSYPELIRIIELRSRWFVNMARELICGTEKEIDNIRTKINENVRIIKDISFSEGDSHREGRMVCIIKFNDDIKIVYKPRALETEDAFNSIINYFNENGNNKNYRKLKLFKYHTTATQGWTEFINFEPCDNESEVHDYYTKMGEFLCIIYMLNGKDFHSENIICSKSDPILIDLETLLHSLVFENGALIEGACSEAIKVVDRSVMKTGFLPMQIVNPKNKKKLEVGAMGRQREQESPFISVTAVRDENGEIKLEKAFGKMSYDNCSPVLNGKKQDAVHFLEDVMNGFELIYKQVCENKEEFIKLITDLFTSKINRVIVRSTNVYDQIVRTSYHPLLLRNAWDRKMFLLKILSVTETDKICSQLVRSELRDMFNGDIPYFMCRSEENELLDSEVQPTEQTFETSLLKSSVNTILDMNEIDMRRQLGFITLSFAEELEEEGIDAANLLAKRNVFPDDMKNKHISKDEFLDRIMQITEDKSITCPDHKVSSLVWLDINRSPDWPTYVSYMRPEIYGGLSGIYMYLSAYSRATGNKKAKEMSAEIKAELKNNLDSILAGEGYDLSGFVGLSGVLYALAHENDNKDELTKLLNILTANIDTKKLTQTDLLSGAAGLMKVLMYVYKKLDNHNKYFDSDKAKTRDKIKELAEELMSRAIYENDNAVYWGAEGYTGYAHGVAGIVDALADYYEFSHDERVLSFIDKGCEYIESCRIGDIRNWARTKERDTVSINWCHGAPGIALMKIRLAEIFGDRFVTRTDLEEIAATIINNGFGEDHCLCHGDMGNLMILKKLAETLNDDKIKEFCMKQYRESLDGLKEKVFGDYFYYSEDTSFMIGPQAIALGILNMEYNENIVDILTLR